MKKELKGLTPETAIHCPTEADYQLVLDLFGIVGFKRDDMNKGWKEYTTNTCIADKGHAYGRIKFWQEEGYEIVLASDFLTMNQEPESEPQWVFKTDEEMQNFLCEAYRFQKASSLVLDESNSKKFLASKRNPPFEIQCRDGVIIRDPEQWVWIINEQYGVGTCSIERAKERYGDIFWSTEEAATEHRRQSSRVISLGDMVEVTPDQLKTSLESGGLNEPVYVIRSRQANELLNERINGN